MSMVKQSVHAEIKALKAKLEEMKNQVISKTFFNEKKEERLTVKIGEKGTINIYGLGRFPVCLYPSQAMRLEKLLTNAEFKQFIIDNAANLAQKKSE